MIYVYGKLLQLWNSVNCIAYCVTQLVFTMHIICIINLVTAELLGFKQIIFAKVKIINKNKYLK